MQPFTYRRHVPRPIHNTANWVFFTRTRGVELINTMFLVSACVALIGTKYSIVKLPMVYNAGTLNLNHLLIGLALLAVLQAIGMFCDGTCKYRWVSALVLSISSAFWAWLAVITYHSAAWLTSIGVHKQVLFAYIILCVICWLAADYIRQDITE